MPPATTVDASAIGSGEARGTKGGRNLSRRALSLLVAAEVPLLCLIAPTLLFPQGLLPLAGLVAVLGLWLIRLAARHQVTVRTPIDLPLLILLAVVPAALYPSVELTFSMPKLYGIVLGVAMYYAVVNSLSTRRAWWTLTVGLMLATVGVSAFGMVSTNWGEKIPLGGSIYSRLPRLVPSVQSSFGAIPGINPNELGGTLAFLLPLPLALVLWTARNEGGEKGTSRRLCLGIGAVATLSVAVPVLVLTQSRGSLAGIVAAAILLLGLRWRWLGFCLATLALLGVLALPLIGMEKAGQWALRLDSQTSIVPSLLEHQEIWARAVHMIQDFPLTGVGLNTFPVVLNNLYPPFLLDSAASCPHAHNIYLQTAVDLGAAGLMAFLGLWLPICGESARAFRRADGPMRGGIAGLSAGVVAYLVYGLTDAITLGAKPLVLLWAMVGLIVAAGRLVEAPRSAGDAAAGCLRPGATDLDDVRLRDATSGRRWRRRAGGWARCAGTALGNVYWGLAILLAVAAYIVVVISFLERAS